MKFSIERADLLRSLNHVQSVVERRNTIPILANVLLKAEGDTLALTATDMDVEVIESVSAKVTDGGVTTVPAHTLYDIVRKLHDDSSIEIESTAGESTLELKSGRSKFRLGCLSQEDFPKMGSSDTFAYNFSIPADALRTLIDRTRFAISTEETRYYLNGIYLHATECDGIDVLRAVATDGHRLARFDMPLPEGAKDMLGVIIPRKTVNEIRKLVDEAGDDIKIAISENKIKFEFDHIALTSKLIDGTFPDYNRVIPANNDKFLEINPNEFANAVDRVATISTEKSRVIMLALSNKMMMLSASTPDSGSATEEIEVNFEADPMEIGFNSTYLIDITKQMNSECCRLSLSDASSPTIIQDVGDTSSLYVLMPMRV